MPPAFAATAARFAGPKFNHSSWPDWNGRMCQAGFSISSHVTGRTAFVAWPTSQRYCPARAEERQAHAESSVRHAASSSPRWGFCPPLTQPRPPTAAIRIAQWLGRCCLARSQRLASILGCIDIWLFQLAQALFFFLLLFG